MASPQSVIEVCQASSQRSRLSGAPTATPRTAEPEVAPSRAYVAGAGAAW